MPQLGEIVTRKVAGLNGHGKVIWSACEGCSKERWVKLRKTRDLCQSCAKRTAIPILPDDERRCKRCEKPFKLTPEFWSITRGRSGGTYLSRVCRECLRSSRKVASQRQKEQTAAYRKNRIAENRAWIQDMKNTTPCKDCNKTYPYYVMEFDHIGPKTYNIGRLTGAFTSRCRISHELKKCELLCANCHRIRTHTRRNEPAQTLPEPEFEHIADCKCQDYFTGTSSTKERTTPLKAVADKSAHKSLVSRIHRPLFPGSGSGAAT